MRKPDYKPRNCDKHIDNMSEKELIEDMLWMLSQKSRSKYDILYIRNILNRISEVTDYLKI